MSDRRNILLVGNYESDVGYAWWLMENFWSAIARHYAKQGRQSFLVYPKVNRVPEIIESADIEVRELDFPNNRTDLNELLTDARIGSVYLTDRPYYSPDYWCLRRNGVNTIVAHDHAPGERSPATGLRRLAKRALYVDSLICCDLYIGVSEFVRRRMHESGGIPSAKTTTVLNGIHPQGRNPAFRNRYRAEFGIPEDGLIVVTTGRATFYKGIDFLIDCAATLIEEQRLSNVFFLHCGDGPDLREFRRMTEDRGISNRFLFAGARSDVRNVLQACDIGIQASRGEAFSLSILEYMDAGLATLVPNVCGNAEAITHGETGFLFEPGDKEAVVELLSRVIADADTRSEIGSAALAAVSAHFDIERTNSELLARLDAVKF